MPSQKIACKSERENIIKVDLIKIKLVKRSKLIKNISKLEAQKAATLMME